MHRSRTNRSSSELVRMFKRSRVQNVAQPPSYIECEKPKLPPSSMKQHAKLAREVVINLTNEVNVDNPRMVSGILRMVSR